MSKKILLAIVLVLFVFGSLASGAQAVNSSDKCYVANEFYDPLEVIANISLGKVPLCVAANDQTNRVYVGVEGGLVVIDGETDEVIAEIPLNPKVVTLAVNTQTNRIYAGVYGENVTVIDGTTNLRVGAIMEALYRQYSLAVNPGTNRVYVSDESVWQGEYDRVSVYNGENFEYITSVNIPGSNNHTYMETVGIAVNPKTNKIYATWSGDNTLHMIGGYTNEITKTVIPSSSIEMVMVNSHSNYVYVGVTVLNGETLEEVITDDSLQEVQAIDHIHNLIYTTKGSTQTLYVYNGDTHVTIDSLKLSWYISRYFDPIAVNSKTSKVYIVHNAAKSVVVIRSVDRSTDETPPRIVIISPENKSYVSTMIPLVFTINESTSWIGYSLNGQTNVTVTGNSTLSLSTGSYWIRVYAYDSYDNMGSSDTISFIVDTASPITTHDYDASWHNTDFQITLVSVDNESGVAETYYLLNNNPVQNLGTDGQPRITIEGANNTLEYWSVDKVGHEEEHHFLTNIALDKTSPIIVTPLRDPSGDVQPNQLVRISVNVSDSLSGVDSVRLVYFTNRSSFGLEFPMMLNQTNGLYERAILVQEASTLVKYQITTYDKAGNNVTDDNAGEYFVYTVLPEFPSFLILSLFIIIALLAVIICRKAVKQRIPTLDKTNSAR